MPKSLQKNTCRSRFLEVTSQKGLHDLCGGKFLGKTRTKIFRTPQNLSGSYTYSFNHPTGVHLVVQASQITHQPTAFASVTSGSRCAVPENRTMGESRAIKQ